MWSSFPLPTLYHVFADPYRSESMVPGCDGAVPYEMLPLNHCLLINTLDRPWSHGYPPEDARKFILNRSIFDLVKAHKVLQLTDPELLGWYLSLPVGDRKLIQDEGGFRLFLQRHPALELFQQRVYVKYSRGDSDLSKATRARSVDIPSGLMFNRVALLENSGAYCPSGAGQCSVDRRELECLPNTVRESLDLLDNHEDCHMRAMHQEPCSSKARGWQVGSINPALYEDSSAQASASLDAELEHHSHWETPCPALAPLLSQARHCGPSDCTEAGLSDSSHSGRYECPSEFYSLDSSQLCTSQLNSSGGTHAVDREGAAAGSSAVGSSATARPAGLSPGAAEPAGSRDEPLSGEKDWEESSDFHSVLEENESVEAGTSGRGPGVRAAPERSTGAGDEAQPRNSAPEKARSVEWPVSPPPRGLRRDVSLGTETRRASVGAQTEAPATADANIFTALHMADLDYLAEEVVKLKSSQRELHELKQRLKSAEEAGERGPCAGCGGRAQRAELRLLALQYTMCQQHAWRDYLTSSDHLAVTTTHAELQGPPAKMISVCQKLQCDYKEMRTKILAGVSLEQLEPLCVSSATLTSSCPYVPPQILGDALEDVATSSGPLESWNVETRGGNEGHLSTEDPKEDKRQEAPVAVSKVNSSHAASLMPEHSGTGCGPGAHHKQTVAGVTEGAAAAWQMKRDSYELSASEAWYDAEEDLDPSSAMAPTGPADIPSGHSDGVKEGLPRKVEEQKSSLLCVSGLPKHVTKSDVMQWFGKDHVSEVSICTFSNNLKVAMVTVNGPLTAEVAVRKMNGVCVQGSTLHVEHIRLGTESLGGPQQRPTASSQVLEEMADAPKPKSTKTNSNITVAKVPGSCPDEHKGPRVPQHCATMGSFDKLMAQLKERHPEAGRKATVEALLQVKARCGGILSGLPLSGIVEMASKQLEASSSSSSGTKAP